MKFEVLRSEHAHNDGKTYKKGDVIETALPLDKMFPMKFKVVEASSASVKFDDEKPEVKVCLSFWYFEGYKNELPLVSECSFDYDFKDCKGSKKGKSEVYPLRVTEGSKRLFLALQNQTDWVNFNATTKTAFAYDTF